MLAEVAAVLAGALYAMSDSAHRAAKQRRLARNPSVDVELARAMIARCKTHTVNAQWFHDGTLLANLRDLHMKTFQDLLGTRNADVPSRKFTWGSMCTGSAGDYFVMHTAQTAMQEQARLLAHGTASGQDSTAPGQDSTASGKDSTASGQGFELVHVKWMKPKDVGSIW